MTRDSAAYPWALHMSPYTMLPAFILGCIAAQAFRLGAKGGTWVGLAILAALQCISGDGYFGFLQRNLLYPAAIAMLILGLASEKTAVSQFLSTARIVFLGEISFSIYLLHPFIPRFMKRESGFPFDAESVGLFALNLALALSFLLLVCVLSYRLIEAPAREKIRALFRRHSSQIPVVHSPIRQET